MRDSGRGRDMGFEGGFSFWGFGSLCLARGTRVSTPTGMRRIERFRVGDLVHAFNEATSRPVVARVADTQTAMRECYRLSLSNRVELVLTTSHPLYCPLERRYAPAGDWIQGSRSVLLAVETPDRDAECVHMLDARYDGIHEVWDLSVESGWRNFLAEGVVTHGRPPSLTLECR